MGTKHGPKYALHVRLFAPREFLLLMPGEAGHIESPPAGLVTDETDYFRFADNPGAISRANLD
jgi:hypothetical protein